MRGLVVRQVGFTLIELVVRGNVALGSVLIAAVFRE